ncbi:chloride channel protein [Novipirellula artificiosorum]|uniref:H(+)/Cl(-) exchange transporter ClcA n=1 Tax=Novipirellula artificiosorum TaxID=2528016 RepID=A0A5C6D911_9BACT|nr:chloride channel protein [Novipirellula artificiosorum]TWU32274.1 H(+)/Cl(-) exchange transporter ClcA [Novipirellula artificiosorum]
MKAIRTILESFDLRSSGKWIVLASLVGVVAGLGAIIFQLLGQLVVHVSLSQFAGYAPPEAAGEHVLFEHPSGTMVPWMIVLIMMIGGLISGLLIYTFAPEAEGHGTDAAIDAFHNKRGVIRGRIPFIKTIASAITLGTGGSGGREGPIAQIGAGFGSWLGTKLKLSHRDRRIMLAAGMGAGVGAIFRAPLAGAVFAGEILYSDADLEADVIVPAATSSIVAYSVYTQSLPAETRFMPLFGDALEHSFNSPIELIPYAALAVILTIVGMIYVKTFYGTHDLFHRLPIIPHIRPAIGAGFAGILAIGLLHLFQGDTRVFATLGTGYGTLQTALTSAADLGVPLLLTIAFAKIATTSLTISSGGSGGVFGPSMVIGGCLGAAVGLGFQSIWPSVVTEPEAFAVVGMAGFFAGVARAPVSTIIMVRAMTGDFGLLVPTMLVVTLTFVTSQNWTLYRKQVPTRMDSKAHRGDFIIDVLEGLRVRDVFKPERKLILIPEGMKLDDIVHRLARNHQHYFPVVDAENSIVGIFTDNDVRSYLYDDTLWELAVARDVMVTNFTSVGPDDDLNTALKRFTSMNVDELPVIEPKNKTKLLGMIRRKEVISAYNQRLMEHKEAAAE